MVRFHGTDTRELATCLPPAMLPLELGGRCSLEELAMGASLAAVEEQEQEVAEALNHLVKLTQTKLKSK